MTTVNSGSDSADEAHADEPGARLVQQTANGLDHHPITADGWRCAQNDECRCDQAGDWSRRTSPLANDQPRLGEEPQPMLPGLEGC